MKQIHWSGILSAALIIFVVASCGTESETSQGDIQVIDLVGAVGKGKIVNISEVADDIKYVALETTDNSLIGQRARVQIINGRIYVISSQYLSFDIKVFDINGKYLFTFNKMGRGPEEYSLMSYVKIDNVTGGFMAFDIFSLMSNYTMTSLCVKEYDKDGKYIKSYNLPVIKPGRLESINKLNENLYISSVGEKSFEPVLIHGIAYDTLSNVLFKIPMATVPDYLTNETIGRRVESRDAKWEKQYLTWSPLIKIFKDVARLIYKYNDTIFTLNQKLNYYPSFVINYGDYRNNSPDIYKTPITKNDYITIDYSTFVESNRFIMMKLYLRESAHEPYDEHIQTKRNDVMTLRRTDCYGMFDKQTGQFNLLNQPVKGKLGIREDINNGPLFFPTDISADDLASTVYSALQLIEHAEVYDVKGDLKELVSKLKDTDNPVVAIAKFK
ncbi:MAG: hypothetical protein A2X19_03050 [Bacteroidetes bacterium GWE2_39_28]|nr:MAG: hypothetical protein A2X19_03050 [Bacteroidetes bacterium GWE2_39_28]OFY16063.1 MAG: hypothetical protein A2X16_10220 [Bacteroidetes bacterium GWF2_39_10]OFZ07370.1 MAG: hypothetical protein A2322_04265 [Bacteroidetes bacterium RIFOXYB2_FULL_39_7]OFZ10088.1 MAG: hypothetical protein A2465_11315 [Bacteroidetes bacterium RIFOXYC2_FULL_39_11]HCT94425.1 hypothetical protein [Rikenellaceae bacterium]